MRFLTRGIFGLICAATSFVVLTAAHAATLSYFLPTPNGVEWKWFDASGKTVLDVYTFPEEPQALYWERDGNAALALSGPNILAFDHRGARIPGADIPIPSLNEGEIPVVLWRDVTTKRLRLATKYDVPDKDISGFPEAPILTDAMRDKIKGLSFPDWGLHVILKVYELYPSKVGTQHGWQVVATVPTKMYAGDVPGLSVLKPYWDEDGYSNNHLISSKFCMSFGAIYPGRVCNYGPEDEAASAFFKAIFPQCVGNIQACPIDAAGKLTCEECIYDLFHASHEVDRLHTVFPVYLRHRPTGTFTPLDDIVETQISGKDGEQVLIGLGGHYVVMEPLRHDIPTQISVINLMSGDLVLHTRGEGAFWLPK
ncbi:MAG: hypothetical protein A2516_00955 [Alphaproteobacteria bacterium RIFOXYD12_FULL_60_8]|nr:MAG: hypothetical protein A2516_00955 [Alphaproteobacteria bacterium RIFOXYD12_FULL_60_8]